MHRIRASFKMRPSEEDMKPSISSAILLECLMLTLLGTFNVPAIAEAKEIQITISNLSFSPYAIRAHVGDQITWINADGVRHEIFFSRNPTRSNDRQLRYELTENRKLSITVATPGDYDYVCRWHNMWGKLHVDQSPGVKQ